MQERNTSNQVTAQLVRDGNIGGILSRTTAQGAAFYGYDGNGNVTLLTNAAGQDVGHYRYDAFGNTLEVQGARAGENPYRFSTKELHGPSGLYDYGFRFYSPGMGRWLNRDPLGEGGGVNLYGMVGNNPVNDVDAYGLVNIRKWKDEVDKWVNGFLEPTKPKSNDEWDEVQRLANATALAKKTGPQAAIVGMEVYMAVMPVPKARLPLPGISNIPSGARLYRSARIPFKGSALTKAGRELSKHPGLVGLTKQSYGPTLRSDARKNLAAHNALKSIMRNGIRTTPYVPRYGGRIIQSKIYRGYGARWYPNGKFIGFINP